MADEPTTDAIRNPDFGSRPKGWMVELGRRAMKRLTPEQRRRAIRGDLSGLYEETSRG